MLSLWSGSQRWSMCTFTSKLPHALHILSLYVIMSGRCPVKDARGQQDASDDSTT